MPETLVRNLHLHEAMVLVLLEQKLATAMPKMPTTDLATQIRERKLYFQIDGGYADASQIGARATQYPALFVITKDGGRRIIGLRQLHLEA